MPNSKSPLYFLTEIWNRSTYRRFIINGIAAVIVLAIIAYLIVQILQLDLDFSFLTNRFNVQLNIWFIEFQPSSSRIQAALAGIINTIVLVLAGIIASTVVGFVVGVGRLSSNILVAKISLIYVEIFRNLPLLAIFFFLAFVVFLSLPTIGEGANILGIAYASNNGFAIPWIASNGSIWWVWIIIIAVAFIAAVLFKRFFRFFIGRYASPESEETSDQSNLYLKIKRNIYKHPNVYSIGVFLLIVIIGYFALDFPVVITEPDIDLSLRFPSYEGGIRLSVQFTAGLLGLTLYFGAFLSEIVRGSIQAIPHGQIEASQALGLSWFHRLRLIILPQALRIMIPAMNNEYQNVNKDSSLSSQIGYTEILFVAFTIVNQSSHALALFIGVFVIYVILNLGISFFMNNLNRRFQSKETE